MRRAAVSRRPISIEDARFAGAIERWFEENRRDLPWRRVDRRTGRRDPYRSLVSEIMLQQTQVSRVVEKFNEFVARFPDVEALARAKEQDVLAAWTGLGYYRRARSLHAAARYIVETHAGRVPERVEELLELPGVGRYTAGAIASMVFGHAEPIVDGNVSRVLLRVHGKDVASDDAAVVRWTWSRAGDLVQQSSPALFNEGLMELGATVCMPAGPRCGACPVRAMCVANREGTQERIPRPKARARQRELWHVCVIVRDTGGRVLLERAAAGSLWKGLWRVPSAEFEEAGVGRGWEAKAAKEIARSQGVRAAPKAVHSFEFKTTACLVRFRVFEAAPLARPKADLELASGAHRQWVDARKLGSMGMSSPTRRMLGLR